MFLILCNLVFFALDHFFAVKWMPQMLLRQRGYHWWQLGTSLFCHSDWQHLSSNLFLLFFFGRLIEEEEGGIALILIYLFCGVISNLVSLALVTTRNTVFLGASGAVFGLFAVSVLVRFRWSWKRLVEFLVIGNFVAAKTMGEMTAAGAAQGGAKRLLGGKSAIAVFTKVNHLGHLAGAAAGVLLVLLVKLLFRNRQSR